MIRWRVPECRTRVPRALVSELLIEAQRCAMKFTALLLSVTFSMASAEAQTYQRQATITGTSNDASGKCTIEVVVDGTVEVQLRGTSGVLQNLAGQPPQWRRFDCSAPMPANPANFRFSGVDGRGKQTLVSDPSQNGLAVIRIEDTAGGAQGYTFNVEWQGGVNNDILRPLGPDANRGGNTQITSAEGVEACQQEISRQASQRFGTNDIYFRRTQIDNNKGAQDRVRGTIDVQRGGANSERYRFDCGINLRNGRIQSAQIDANPAPANTRDYGYSNNSRYANSTQRAMQACEAAVNGRLNEQGYQRAGVASIDFDESNSSGNRIFGSARVNDRGGRGQTLDFSCTVDMNTGNVQSADVIPRRTN
jgi:hypothetical protein